MTRWKRKRKSQYSLNTAIITELILDRLNEEELKEVTEKCNALRVKLAKGNDTEKGKAATREKFKGHQVHEMADAKLKEMDKWGRALKIPSNYEEGSHWRRQEERMRSAVERDDNDEEERRHRD